MPATFSPPKDFAMDSALTKEGQKRVLKGAVSDGLIRGFAAFRIDQIFLSPPAVSIQLLLCDVDENGDPIVLATHGKVTLELDALLVVEGWPAAIPVRIK